MTYLCKLFYYPLTVCLILDVSFLLHVQAVGLRQQFLPSLNSFSTYPNFGFGNNGFDYFSTSSPSTCEEAQQECANRYPNQNIEFSCVLSDGVYYSCSQSAATVPSTPSTLSQNLFDNFGLSARRSRSPTTCEEAKQQCIDRYTASNMHFHCDDYNGIVYACSQAAGTQQPSQSDSLLTLPRLTSSAPPATCEDAKQECVNKYGPSHAKFDCDDSNGVVYTCSLVVIPQLLSDESLSSDGTGNTDSVSLASTTSPTTCEQARQECIDKYTSDNMQFDCDDTNGIVYACSQAVVGTSNVDSTVAVTPPTRRIPRSCEEAKQMCVERYTSKNMQFDCDDTDGIVYACSQAVATMSQELEPLSPKIIEGQQEDYLADAEQIVNSVNSSVAGNCSASKWQCQQLCGELQIVFECVEDGYGQIVEGCSCMEASSESFVTSDDTDNTTQTPTEATSSSQASPAYVQSLARNIPNRGNVITRRTTPVVPVPSIASSWSSSPVRVPITSVTSSALASSTASDRQSGAQSTVALASPVPQQGANATMVSNDNQSQQSGQHTWSDFDSLCAQGEAECLLGCGDAQAEFECEMMGSVIAQSCGCVYTPIGNGSAGATARAASTATAAVVDRPATSRRNNAVIQQSDEDLYVSANDKNSTNAVSTSVAISSSNSSVALVTTQVQQSSNVSGQQDAASNENSTSIQVDQNVQVQQQQDGDDDDEDEDDKCRASKKRCKESCGQNKFEFDCSQDGLTIAQSCVCVPDSNTQELL
eukprot:TRINITY_DN1375_c0_g1_i5.p1 TRINITY_DN1375_c0_g1~~TRINITY_DN1375_c0_g1_i5.p1  ORF type:complete len:773 (-),score=64.26 TRINITY_DN1375_c0_g1_i5:632-2911(-)